ncbi:hypothetical protein EDB86DRAFT_3242495 [Lactarius hatsudake]|nr:hypothetical protein EDB86DRAFT_3242495 [Lactarius hatsudake]
MRHLPSSVAAPECNNEENESVTEDDLGPLLTDPGKGLESISDSTGITIATVAHEVLGCKFSHAPDHKSAHPTKKEDRTIFWSKKEMLQHFGEGVDDDWGAERQWLGRKGFTDDKVQELL